MSGAKLSETYRPTRFADFVGQGAAVAALQKLVIDDRPDHILLHGPAGTGKTSLARVYANAFECTAPDPAERPCRSCAACSEFPHTRNCFIEMGSISAQEARQFANAPPPALLCRFKFYFFDEAQSIHSQAFDLLLKTMEDEKSRIKYIFATTNIDQIPETIRQRCEQIETKSVTTEVLKTFCEKVVAKESISISNGGIDLLTRLAQGSVRTLLNYIQRAAGHGAQNADDMRALFGLASLNQIPLYLAAVLATKGAREEDKFIQAWNADLYSKCEHMYAYLLYLYSSRCEHLDRTFSIFHGLDEALGDSIVEGLNFRARSQGIIPYVFWSQLWGIWHPTKSNISQADFDNAFHQFRFVANRSIPTAQQVKRWRSERRVKRPRDQASPKKASAKHGGFLSQTWFNKIKAAGQTSRRDGAYFNALIRIHWKRAHIEKPEEITNRLGKLLHRLRNMAGELTDEAFTYIYLHEVHPTAGIVTTVVLHLPPIATTKVLERIEAEFSPAAKGKPVYFVLMPTETTPAAAQRRHLRFQKFLFGYLDPVLARHRQRDTLQDELRVPHCLRRSMGTAAFQQPIRFSGSLLSQPRALSRTKPSFKDNETSDETVQTKGAKKAHRKRNRKI